MKQPIWDRLKNHVRRVLKWYSNVLFADSIGPGSLIFLAGLGSMDWGFSGLLCGHLTFFIAKGLEFPRAEVETGTLCTNGVLLGLFFGTHFRSYVLLISFSIIGSLLVVFCFRAFSNSIGYFFRIPTCSYPFVLGTIIFSYACGAQEKFFGIDLTRPFTYSTGLVDVYWHQTYLHTALSILQREIYTFVVSLGAIIFQKNWFFAILACIALLIHSRVHFFLAATGFAFMRLLVHLLPLQCSGFETLLGFNSILIAISIGGVFFVPEIYSFLTMLGAQLLALIFGIFLASVQKQFGVEFTALPFNFLLSVVLLAMHGRFYHARPYQPSVVLPTPEEMINYYNRYQDRIFLKAIPIPVFGTWTIIQGFEGEETHKAEWKYGVDFAVVDEGNRRFRGTGITLEDYFCFGAAVRSPVAGAVSSVLDIVPDNPVGEINLQNPWGNYVIVYSTGLYIGFYHLKRGSIQVAPGQLVHLGSPLGKIGNSGRSALPHLHFQIQLSPVPGAANIPFLFQDILIHLDDEKRKFKPFFRPQPHVSFSEIDLAENLKSIFVPKVDEDWIIEIHEGKREVSSQKLAGTAEGAKRPTAGDEGCEVRAQNLAPLLHPEGGRVPPFIEKLQREDYQKWTFSWTLEGNVLIKSDSGDSLEYAFRTKYLEVLRFPNNSLSPLTLYGILLADFPFQILPDLQWEAQIYGKTCWAFCHTGKKVLALLLGDIFSVSCLKTFVEEDSERDQETHFSVETQFFSHGIGTRGSKYTFKAYFGEMGFQELILYSNGKPLKTCRRITTR